MTRETTEFDLIEALQAVVAAGVATRRTAVAWRDAQALSAEARDRHCAAERYEQDCVHRLEIVRKALVDAKAQAEEATE